MDLVANKIDKNMKAKKIQIKASIKGGPGCSPHRKRLISNVKGIIGGPSTWIDL